MQGYVALHRQIMDSWVAEDPLALSLWVRMLLEATHKPRKKPYKGRNYHLEPGQFLFGLGRWSEKTGLGREVIRKRVDMFEQDGMITRSKQAQTSIITISNWKMYQHDNRVTTDSQQPDNTLPTDSQQKYNNVNNGDNGNNVNNSVSEKPETPKRSPRKKFVKPTFDEVMNYFIERGIESMVARNKTEVFMNHYESNGWKVGKNPMKDWKATVRTWVAKMNGDRPPPKQPGETLQQYKDRTEALKQGGRQYLSDD